MFLDDTGDAKKDDIFQSDRKSQFVLFLKFICF